MVVGVRVGLLTGEPVFDPVPVIWGSTGLSLDDSDQDPRERGFSAPRLPSTCSVPAVALSENKLACNGYKSHINSLNSKGYKLVKWKQLK